MKLGLNLGVSQQLAMTPQLQQAIKLLQMSTLELEQEIQETLETNPLLEIDEEATAPPDGEATDTGKSSAEATETPGEASDIPDEMPTDSDWSDSYDDPSYEMPAMGLTRSAGNRSDDSDLDAAANRSETESLRDYLLWQMGLSGMTRDQEIIAEVLIDTIDDDGYLRQSLEEVARLLGDEEHPCDEAQVAEVLARIQQFDPVGVGARDLAECLRLQLEFLETPDDDRQAALRVLDHLELLGRAEYAAVMQETGLDREQLASAVALIQSLNPRPGSTISAAQTEYVVPDVLVRKHQGRWVAELNPAVVPRLRVNDYYAGLIKRRENSPQNNYLRKHLNEARWFISSLHSRNDTLMRVAERILERQAAFFDHGPQAMQPMVLRDIAEELDLHESTISRVTNRKYMHTPRGVFELKYFFSSHVGTDDGGQASATAIRARIDDLIRNETKPLSDSALAARLQEEGIQVARRTVAKYREQLRHPPASERRKVRL